MAECLPALRSTTLARAAAIRSSTEPASRAALLDVAGRDVDNFLRETGADCSKVDVSPAARACPLAQEIAQLRRLRPPAPIVVPGSPPPKEPREVAPRSERRPLLVAGAVSMSIGALALGGMAAGLVLGHQKTKWGQETAPDTRPLRTSNNFDVGVASNKLVVAGAIIGGAAIVVGVALLVADAVGHRRRDRRRAAISANGLRISF